MTRKPNGPLCRPDNVQQRHRLAAAPRRGDGCRRGPRRPEARRCRRWRGIRARGEECRRCARLAVDRQALVVLEEHHACEHACARPPRLLVGSSKRAWRADVRRPPPAPASTVEIHCGEHALQQVGLHRIGPRLPASAGRPEQCASRPVSSMARASTVRLASLALRRDSRPSSASGKRWNSSRHSAPPSSAVAEELEPLVGIAALVRRALAWKAPATAGMGAGLQQQRFVTEGADRARGWPSARCGFHRQRSPRCSPCSLPPSFSSLPPMALENMRPDAR